MSYVDLAALRASRNLDTLVEQGLVAGTSPILDLTNNQTRLLLFTTGPKSVHLYLSFVATGHITLDVFVGPTVTAPGTPVPIGSFNFIKPYTSLSTLAVDPTVSANGTKIADFLLPGGAGGNRVGTSQGTPTKVILPPNTQFLFSILNEAGSDTSFEPTFVYYEIGVS